MTTTIGRGTNFSGRHQLVSSKDSKIIIGNFCAISDNVIINTLNHDYNFPAIQGLFYKKYFGYLHPGEIGKPSRERTKGDVVIGNNVLIGQDVWISGGITIGDCAIIGAKSVVTKDIPAYSICVGCPCVSKKKVYDDTKIKFIKELKWWEWDDEKIRNNKQFFYTDINASSIEDLKKIII